MTQPIWITTPGSIGSVYENTLVDIQLSVQSPSPTQFYLISGDLPPGVTLSKEDGIVHGNIPILKQSGVYYFSIRAVNTDGFSDRSFSLTVIDYSTVWSTSPNLGTIVQKSFFRVVLSAVDIGFTQLTFDIVGGELPDGLTLEKNGILSGYVVPIDAVFESYTFIVRANGVIPTEQTFSITVTQIGDVAPNWNTIGSYKISNSVEGGLLGVAFNNTPFQFQLLSHDVIGSPTNISYTLVSGLLPNGLTLSSSGLISGTTSTQIVGINPFVVVISDGYNTVSRSFYIKTNFFNSSDLYWLLDSTVIPIDLSSVLPNNEITFDIDSETYNISNTSDINTFEESFIKNINDIYGLSIQNTLLINAASDTQFFINKFYNNTSYKEYTLTSITTGTFIFNVGSVYVGEKCAKRVLAISPNSWVRYQLIEGQLPDGLELNPVSGDIFGVVRDQTLGNYNFKIKAYNNTNAVETLFNITVNRQDSYKPKRLTTRFKGFDQILWKEFNSLNLVPFSKVFRNSDENYDEYNRSEIVILTHVDDQKDLISQLLSDKIPTYLIPQYFVSTPVTDENGDQVCEAVVLRYTDAFRKSYIEFANDPSKNPPNTPLKTFKPGGLEAIRDTLIDAGIASETYEDWMGLYFSTDINTNSFKTTNFPHEFLVGDKIVFINQTLPSPFENDIHYYVIPIDAYSFRLSSSTNNALSNVYIAMNPNESVERSGTLKTFFAGSPIAYITKNNASSIATSFNNLINKTPFGFYNLTKNGNTFEDTFFILSSGHQLLTGDPIMFSDEVVPKPLVFGRVYYVIKIDDDTFALAVSKANAAAGISVTLVNTIDDQTSLPYYGSFKKITTTMNRTINLTEVDLRFKLDVDCVCLDDKFLYKDFVSNPSTDTLTIVGHGLETGIPISFINQTLDPNLSNDTDYFAIVIDEDTIRVATTYYNSFANSYINFSTTFSGLVKVDRSVMIYINKKNTYTATSITTQNCFVTDKTSDVLLGDQIIFNELSNTVDISLNTPYFIIPIKNTVFSIATSLINAQNGVYIPLTVFIQGSFSYVNGSTDSFWQRYR